MLQVGHPVGASFEYFDLVVEAFNKAAGFTLNEVIQYLIPPTCKRIDKAIKAAQSAFGNCNLEFRGFWTLKTEYGKLR